MVPLVSVPPNFVVASQVPSIFLSSSCSGPGLGNSWARAAGAASATARATAQDQRSVVIEALREGGRPAPGAPRPRSAARRVGRLLHRRACDVVAQLGIDFAGRAESARAANS